MKPTTTFFLAVVLLAAAAPASEPWPPRTFTACEPAPWDFVEERPASPRRAQQFRVLMVGDSWSWFMTNFSSMRDAFAANGYPDFLEKGDVTAINGSTASDWVAAGNLNLITSELAANPSIDTVQLSLGGNDLLAGAPGNGWFLGMPTAQEEALLDAVQADIQLVVDHCLAQRPDIEVLLISYDYPNFDGATGFLGFSFCQDIFADTGQPTIAQTNAILLRLEQRKQAIAAADPRLHYGSNVGWMQFGFGFPSQGIAPGVLVPPGDASRPSPREAIFSLILRDCIHLNDAGYDIVAQNLFDTYYAARFAPATSPSAFILH